MEARECPDSEEAAREDLSVDWKLSGTEKSLTSDEEMADELFAICELVGFTVYSVFCQLYDVKSLLFPEHEVSEIMPVPLAMLLAKWT